MYTRKLDLHPFLPNISYDNTAEQPGVDSVVPSIRKDAGDTKNSTLATFVVAGFQQTLLGIHSQSLH